MGFVLRLKRAAVVRGLTGDGDVGAFFLLEEQLWGMNSLSLICADWVKWAR